MPRNPKVQGASDVARSKMREAHLGRKPSEEAKQKMRDAYIARVARTAQREDDDAR